jgi:hypothetical protein
MDLQLRKLMRQRQDARDKLDQALREIVAYVANELDAQDGGFRAAELREAYIVGFLAESLAEAPDFDPDVESIDAFVLNILSKKGHIQRGNSQDYRTRDEQRAYGNAKEAWSYVLKEAGLR